MRFILTPVNTEKQAKRIKGSLVKDIRRQFWTDLIRSIILWVRALGSISINHRPSLPTRRIPAVVYYFKSFQIRWYHMVIAILATLLLSPHAGAVQSTAPSVKTVKFTPQKTLKQPPEAPQAQLAAVPVAPPAPVVAPVTVGGSCADWLAAAGIPNTTVVMAVINRESGCRPTAQNPSGACGIGQDINGCEVGYDPVAQLIWMNTYVMTRYHSWDAAWAHELSFGWY